MRVGPRGSRLSGKLPPKGGEIVSLEWVETSVTEMWFAAETQPGSDARRGDVVDRYLKEVGRK